MPTTSWKKFINARNVYKEKEGNYVPQNKKKAKNDEEFCEITFCFVIRPHTHARVSEFVCVKMCDVRIGKMSKIWAVLPNLFKGAGYCQTLLFICEI